MMQIGANRSGGMYSATKKRVLIVSAVIVFAATLATAIFFFVQYTMVKSNPNAANQQKTDRVIEKVSDIYALPSEKPTVADITDKNKLKDQAFFKNAENGDFLLIFSETKLAIIYRESSNKLINVGPISLDNRTTEQE